MQKILVALSGGVDSAVVALLLKNKGLPIEAVYMRTWMNEADSNIFADCPWAKDLEDARAVAEVLNIPLRVVNMIEEYKKRIVKHLVEGYQSGTTPNPDIMCNREIKFGTLLEYAEKEGFSKIATGHYCQLKEEQGAMHLLEGADRNKDQSYFLAMVKKKQLSKMLFPIGHLAKPEVRKLAQEANLPNANKKDSQGICFLGKVSINDFLKQYIPDKPGNIVNQEGKILGKHQGLHRYTLGQRKGIGVPSNSDFAHYVVIQKNFDTNELIIGFDHDTTPGLFTTQVTLTNINLFQNPITKATKLTARPRYRDEPQEITYTPVDNNTANISFQTPQRALAPGQVLALYNDNELLGGGVYSI